MDIRPAGLQDADVVCGLRLEFMAEFRGVTTGDLPADFREATRRFVEGCHARGSMLSWPAEHDGTAQGLVSMLLQEAPPRVDDVRSLEGLVANLYVRRPWRRRGSGRLLLEACRDAAGGVGVRRLNLYATSDGRPLYDAAGFVARADWMVLDLPVSR